MPHPGVFAKEFGCLIAKELRFLATTKSLQQYANKGVRKFFNAEAQRTQRSEELCGLKKYGATQIVIKTKRLLKEGFVSI